MATISKPNTFSAGAVVIAAEHNENFDTIYNEFNGSISNANIASNANITDTKLAQLTTANKVATSAIQSGALAITKVTGTSTHLTETTAPTTAASEGALYTKDTSGQPELFFREESSGDEVQITSDGVINGYIKAANIYDSDWFSVSTGNSYAKTHSLGTLKFVVKIFIADDASGTNAYVPDSTVIPSAGSGGAEVGSITTTSITLVTGSASLFNNSYFGHSGSSKTSGYARIIMIALS